MQRIVMISAAGAAFLASSVAFSADAKLARRVKELQARVAALEGRVTKLEAKPRITVTLDYARLRPTRKLNEPLDDEQKATVAKARARLARLAEDARKHGGQLSPFPGLDRDTVVGRWADAFANVATVLADYGQEGPCLSALAAFHAGKDKTEKAQRTFERAAYRCAAVFNDRWTAPDSAMRIAATYGPGAQYTASLWGALCERCARASGKRDYKHFALKCYLRAAVIDPRVANAWRRARALEHELRPAL